MENLKKWLSGCVATGLTLVCLACAPLHQTVTPELRTKLMDGFKNGKANLPCELECDWSWVTNRNIMILLYNNNQWEQLAELVMQIGHNRDLAYYYLGRSAECLGYYDAASIYYKKSVFLYNDSDPLHHCREQINGCGGLDLSAILPERIAVVQKSKNQKTAGEVLNEAVIKRLFTEKFRVEKNEVDIDAIKFVKVDFIDEKNTSAIVNFKDLLAGNNFQGNLWLLTSDNGWRIKRRLLSDYNIGDFKIMKLGKGIKPAIMATGGGHGTGVIFDFGVLAHIENNKDDIIFAYENVDACGSGLKNAEFNEHKIEFKDIDGDGVLEILDTEKKGKCGKDYEPIVKQTIKSVYKFNGKKYVKIK